MGDQRDLEGLEVWRVGQDFAVEVCGSLLPRLPKRERFALSEQLRRSVQSIPANIAEAHGRYHFADAVRFCYIARGSLQETWSHILLAGELGYVSPEVVRSYGRKYKRLGKLINGYIRFMKREAKHSK